MDKNSTQKLPTIDALHEALENDNRETAKMVIASLHPSEIADILESVPGRERAARARVRDAGGAVRPRGDVRFVGWAGTVRHGAAPAGVPRALLVRDVGRAARREVHRRRNRRA